MGDRGFATYHGEDVHFDVLIDGEQDGRLLDKVAKASLIKRCSDKHLRFLGTPLGRKARWVRGNEHTVGTQAIKEEFNSDAANEAIRQPTKIMYVSLWFQKDATSSLTNNRPLQRAECQAKNGS